MTPAYLRKGLGSSTSEDTASAALKQTMTDPRDRYNVRLETDEDAQRRSAGSVHHGGSFKKYMEGKNRKLREQFAAEARAGQADGTADPSKSLLKGISIHVNGFTIPSHQASVAALRTSWSSCFACGCNADTPLSPSL